MVEYGKALERGLSFGIKPKRWLQFFVLDLIFVSIILAVVLPRLSEIIPIVTEYPQDMTKMLGLAGVGVSIAVVFVVWMLVRFWFMGAVVHQSFKEKGKVSESFSESGRKYLHILVAIIIVSVIVGAVSFIPYIGWIIGIILGWAFFFVLQGIMVSRLGFWGAIENSCRIFRRNPLQVFLAWLLIAVLTIVINIIFAIPAMLLFFGIIVSIVPMYAGGPAPTPEAIASVSQVLQANISALVVVGIIALVGFAISQIFALKAQTEFYQQLKRKK